MARRRHGILPGCEAWRVGDDDVPSITAVDRRRQEREGIEYVKPRAVHGQIVEFEVAPRGLDGGSRQVDGVRAEGAGQRRVHRKATGVAKQVQDGLASGSPRHPYPVLALVDEEAALLPVRQIHHEPDAVLHNLSFVLLCTRLAQGTIQHRPNRQTRSRCHA